MRLAALALGLFAVGHVLAADYPASPAALETYNEGKRRYDAKDFSGALSKFDECAAMEPQNARWPYNRGLALKKLRRDGEAVKALLDARALDPDYKRSEVAQKLSELGHSDSPAPGTATGAPAGSTPATTTDVASPAPASESGPGEDGWIYGLMALGFCGVFVYTVIKIVMSIYRGFSGSEPAATKGKAKSPPRVAVDPAALASLRARADAVAAVVTRAEHGMSLGEDDDARAHLDHAALNLKLARVSLEKASQGRESPVAAEAALVRTEASAKAATERLRALRGSAFDRAHGERVGCFFCARPLPTPQSRTEVGLRLDGEGIQVTACAVCARNVAAGQAPRVVTVNGQHWSASQGFDPYIHGHNPPPQVTETPAWKLGPLAAVAGTAALGTLAAAALLDLDGARASSLVSGASRAAADSASSRRSRDWQDHS